MRSAHLRVLGDVYVTHPSSAASASSVERAKGKARAELSEIVVETPTDVRVYIDQRCPETVNWFEKSFCDSERRGMGIRLEVGGQLEAYLELSSRANADARPRRRAGEEVVIFASYPSTDSIANVKPAVTLLLGRPMQVRVRQPRPDDPMPRGTLASLFRLAG